MPSPVDPRRFPRSLLLFERRFDWRITGRWMLYSALVGVLCAFVSLLFSFLVRQVSDLALVDLVGYALPLPAGEVHEPAPFDLNRALNPLRRWWLLVVPAAGGLLSGWLVYRFAPEAEGHGTDGVIRAFHLERGIIHGRVPVVKMLASALTIGSGGSAGREGPITQIGAAIASILAQRLGLSERERRLLLVAGMAAGIASIFRSPLGGAFFAVEVLYREDLESEALMPAAIAGITAYSVSSSIEGSQSVFVTPHFAFVSPFELLPLILFALICALVGIAYVAVFDGSRRQLFDRLPVPQMVKPAIGGLLVGGMAVAFPAILGSSYGWLQHAIEGNLPLAVMGVLVVTKIVATSFTIGSGGSGGVFAPSLVIGGMLGGIFGQSLNLVVPDLVTQPGAYVMIGMATFFTAVGNVPIATTIMISELTGSYTLLVPLLFSGVLVHIVTRRWSLYREQVRTQGDSPAHRTDLTPDLLASTRVRSVIEHPVYYHTLSASNTLPEMLSVFTRTREVVLPVVSGDVADSRYSGMVLLEDVQSLLGSADAMRHLIVARDLEVPFVHAHLDDTLDQVLELFLKTEYPELPVVDEDGTIVGFVRQGQVINEYYRAYLRRREAEATE
jgi:chloride channel protein, CIC family